MVKHSYNLSHYNPVAPMAIQENFKDDAPKIPYSPDKPNKERCFKVILNSQDRLDSSILTQPKFKINLPDTFKSKRLNIVVDTLVHNTAPNVNTNLEAYSWSLSIREFRNPYSYNSSTGNTHGTILVAQTRNYQNNTPRDIGGMTLVDRNIFDRAINLEFTSPHFVVTGDSGLLNDYTIVMSIYDDGSD